MAACGHEAESRASIELFVERACAYRRLLDGRTAVPLDRFAHEMASALSKLYGAALQLPETEHDEGYEKEPDRETGGEQIHWGLIERWEERYGPCDRFYMVFDPFAPEAEAIPTSLGSNLSEVSDDLAGVEAAAGEPPTVGRVWWWRFHFTHWGHHAAAALYALHWMIHRQHLEDE